MVSSVASCRSWAWTEVKWHLWNHKSDQLCCAIGGNVENVFALLQQMVQLFTHQSARRQTDKVCELCIIKWQDAVAELLGHSAHPCEVSELTGLRPHDHPGWVSCVGHCSGEPQWCGQALWKYSFLFLCCMDAKESG